MNGKHITGTTWVDFLDPHCTCGSAGLCFRPGPVVKHGPVLVPEEPWERSLNGFGSLLFDPHAAEFRYYYNQLDPRVDGVFTRCIMMAVSKDGMRWDKPELTAVEHQGRKTNLIGIDLYDRGWGAVIPSVIQRGKDDWEMFFWGYRLPEHGGRQVHCLRAVSKDGVHWIVPDPERPVAMHTDPALKRKPRDPFDPRAPSEPATGWRVPLAASRLRSNDASFVYASPSGGYEFYGVWRVSNRGPRMAHTSSLFRTIQRRTSPDGRTWSAPDLILMPDDRDALTHQFYYLSVTPWQGYHLGLLGVYTMDVRGGQRTIEPQLVVSTDGRQWSRPCREPLIPRGGDSDFDSQLIMCPNRMVEKGNDWLLLYGGTSTPHALNPGEGEPFEGSIGLATLPTHRLMGVRAGPETTFRSRAFFCDAPALYVDAHVEEGGEIRAELTDPLGQTVPGFSFEQAVPLRAGTARRPLRWQGASLKRFVGEMVSVRLRARKAHVFGLGCVSA